MYWEVIGNEYLAVSDMLRFNLGPQLQGQTRVDNLKSVYNLLIIGPRRLQCEANLLGNHGL